MQESGVELMHRLHALAERQDHEQLDVRFLSDLVQNDAKSQAAQRPIFDEVEICEIRIPGDKDVRRVVVTDRERERFPKQYLAFKQNSDQATVSGTPLSELPWLSAANREEARYFGLRTVEQLAEMGDVYLQKLGPGWVTQRQKARDYLLKAKDSALLARLRDELAERDRKIATLEDMLNKQAAELRRPTTEGVAAAPAVDVAAMVAEQVQRALAAAIPPPKKRGRPKKDTNGTAQ